MQIPLFRPTMRRRYMHSVLTRLVEEDIGPGKTTRELVNALALRLGAAGGAALSSVYAAIAVASEALGLKAGDRVVVPALAPAVYQDVLGSRGLDVVLVDVDAASGLLTADILRAVLPRSVKAVFACPSADVALDAGVPVVEEVTGSLPSPEGSEAGLLAPQADLLLVSLEPGRAITAGGGAALLTHRRALVSTLRSAAGNAAMHEQLPNVGAALALAQLEDFDADRARRLEIAALYRRAVHRSRHQVLGATDDGIGYAFAVRLQDGLADARLYARKHGVETQPAFEDTCAARSEELARACPNARKLLLCCLSFPLYPMLSRKHVESVCRVLATLP